MKAITAISRAMTVSILLAAGLAVAGEQEQESKELADIGQISVEEAITAVTEDFPGKVIEVELEDESNQLIYEVEIVGNSGKTWEFEVDAMSGQVIGAKPESEDEGAAEDEGPA